MGIYAFLVLLTLSSSNWGYCIVGTGNKFSGRRAGLLSPLGMKMVRQSDETQVLERPRELRKGKIDEEDEKNDTGMSWMEEMKEKAITYGPAGALALALETTLFWVIFLLPATAYFFHKQSGLYVPLFSDSKSLKQFGSVFGGVYVFSKIPPIEAARWACAFAMTPWIAERIPDDLNEAMKKGMPFRSEAEEESES